MGAYYALLATVGLVLIGLIFMEIQICAEDHRNKSKDKN